MHAAEGKKGREGREGTKKGDGDNFLDDPG
jgi:hypothetical protein